MAKPTEGRDDSAKTPSDDAPDDKVIPMPGAAPIESDAVETEMRDDSPPPEPKANQAELTGPQMAQIRVRNEATDKANKLAQEAQMAAQQAVLLAQYAQEALTAYVGQLIGVHDLDQGFQYQVDLNRGRLVAVARIAPPNL